MSDEKLLESGNKLHTKRYWVSFAAIIAIAVAVLGLNWSVLILAIFTSYILVNIINIFS